MPTLRTRVPFLPERAAGPTGELTYGGAGVLKAAGVIFFAYLGFDALATAAQESRNPQRTLPIAILATLAVTTVLYIAVALTMTGLTNYRLLNSEAPLTTALAAAGPSLAWLKTYLGIAVMTGLWASLWPALFGLSRLFMSLSHDGMLPRGLGEIVPGRRIPQGAVLLAGGLGMLVAGFLPISFIGELISTGTLIAFATVCAALIRAACNAAGPRASVPSATLASGRTAGDHGQSAPAGEHGMGCDWPDRGMASRSARWCYSSVCGRGAV